MPLAAPPAAAPLAVAPAAAQGSAAVGSSAAAPSSRRYHTRVGPTPPFPPRPRPSQRAPPSKKAWTSGPGESSSSKPQEPQSPPHQGPVGAPPLDLYPASIIRRPLFYYNPIPGNADCSERDLHDEVYYDLSSFSTDLELQDSMLLVQRYSLEPFMTPRQFFYPRVVIEFYHTMTSKRESNPTTLYFSINSRPGIVGPQTSQLHSIFRWSSPTRAPIGSGPIPRPGSGPSSFWGHYHRDDSVQEAAPTAYASYRSHSAV